MACDFNFLKSDSVKKPLFDRLSRSDLDSINCVYTSAGHFQ